MGKILVSLTTATLLLVTTPFFAQAQSTAPERMLAAVNAARAADGMTALTLDERLNAAACRQARDLAGNALHQVETLSHRGSDGSDLAGRLRDAGYRFRLAAENLAAGVADPAETVRLWLARDGHRRNILTADFRQAGIAHVGPRLSPGGNRMGPMEVWVMVLATPQTADERPPSANNPNDCR
jgi:uncharacterized protein YkwD